MLAIAIWLGTLGYTLLYYGERLWVGEAVTIAEALGFSDSGPGGAVRLGPGTIDYLKQYGLTADEVAALVKRARKEGRPAHYYLPPDGPGWTGAR